jgi:hypothetical protein
MGATYPVALDVLDSAVAALAVGVADGALLFAEVQLASKAAVTRMNNSFFIRSFLFALLLLLNHRHCERFLRSNPRFDQHEIAAHARLSTGKSVGR